jgi:hypothetical protein
MHSPEGEAVMKVGARENVRQNGKMLWRKSKSNPIAAGRSFWWA